MKNNKEILETFLKKIKFKDDEIIEILNLVDNDIDIQALFDKIRFLADLNLHKRVIRIIVEENPFFLTDEISLIKENVSILNKYATLEEIAIILEVTPEILSMKQGDLEQNLKLIKIISNNEENFKIILKDRGEVLTYNPDYLSKKLEFLVKNGLKENIENIIISNMEIFDLENDEIDLKKLKENL